MASTYFDIPDLEKLLNFRVIEGKLFDKKSIKKVQPSKWLSETLELSNKIPLRTKKIRSELIVSPLLLELVKRNRDFLTYYSGEILSTSTNRNTPIDFFLTKETRTYTINLPIITTIEVTTNDVADIENCLIQIHATKEYNEKYGQSINTIYGCITSAKNWKFLKLENNLVTIDTDTYFISEIETIIGVFQLIIDYYKNILN